MSIPDRNEVASSGAKFRFANWLRCLNGSDSLISYLHERDGKLLSRKEVFDLVARDPVLGLSTSVIWGYPTGTMPGGRWHQFRELVARAPEVWAALCPYRETEIDPLHLLSRTPRVRYIGLSTWSKIYYFLGLRTAEGPALIYDQFVMDGTHCVPVPETAELRALIPNGYELRKQGRSYGLYLRSVSAWAKRIGVQPDQLELLLFRTAPRRGRSPFIE